MYGQITVTHAPGDFLAGLAAALPPDNRACLQRSLILSQQPAWQQLVAYAAETPQWRIAVYADGANQWQIIVESVYGELRTACQSLWRSVREAVGHLSPKLERLELLDEATNQILTRASVGLLPQLRRRELWLPLVVGVANAILLAATGADSAVVLGAIPGFAAAALALLAIIWDGMRRSLVWHA